MAAQMCLCPDASGCAELGSHPILQRSGMHLATQSKGWSVPEGYYGAALLWVKSYASPFPVYKVRLGLSGCAKCTVLIRQDFSIYWSQKALIFQLHYPSLLSVTHLPSPQHGLVVADAQFTRLADTPHGKPSSPCSENQPQN